MGGRIGPGRTSRAGGPQSRPGAKGGAGRGGVAWGRRVRGGGGMRERLCITQPQRTYPVCPAAGSGHHQRGSWTPQIHSPHSKLPPPAPAAAAPAAAPHPPAPGRLTVHCQAGNGAPRPRPPPPQQQRQQLCSRPPPTRTWSPEGCTARHVMTPLPPSSFLARACLARLYTRTCRCGLGRGGGGCQCVGEAWGRCAGSGWGWCAGRGWGWCTGRGASAPAPASHGHGHTQPQPRSHAAGWPHSEQQAGDKPQPPAGDTLQPAPLTCCWVATRKKGLEGWNSTRTTRPRFFRKGFWLAPRLSWCTSTAEVLPSGATLAK